MAVLCENDELTALRNKVAQLTSELAETKTDYLRVKSELDAIFDERRMRREAAKIRRGEWEQDTSPHQESPAPPARSFLRKLRNIVIVALFLYAGYLQLNGDTIPAMSISIAAISLFFVR